MVRCISAQQSNNITYVWDRIRPRGRDMMMTRHNQPRRSTDVFLSIDVNWQKFIKRQQYTIGSACANEKTEEQLWDRFFHRSERFRGFLNYLGRWDKRSSIQYAVGSMQHSTMNMDIRVQCRTNCLCLAELYERNSSFVIVRCEAVFVANFSRCVEGHVWCSTQWKLKKWTYVRRCSLISSRTAGG